MHLTLFMTHLIDATVVALISAVVLALLPNRRPWVAFLVVFGAVLLFDLVVRRLLHQA